jgi:polysaccharide biosynthesis transport protein
MSNNLPAPQEPHESPASVLQGTAAPLYRQPLADAAGGNNLRLLWRRVYGSIWRYKWLALAIVVTGAGIGYFASDALVTPRYTVYSTLWVDGYHAAGRDGPLQPSRLLSSAGWIELMRSFSVLDPVVHELRLYVEPRLRADAAAFQGFELESRVRPGDYRFQVDRTGRSFTLARADGTVIERGQAGEPVGIAAGFRWLPPADVYVPGRQIDFTVRRPHQVAQELAASLDIRARDNGNFLAVGLAGEDPEQLALTLNAVTSSFLTVAGELKAGQSKELTQILEEQLAHAARNLQESESALQGFRVTTVTLPSDRVIQQAPGLQQTQGSVFGDFFNLKLERDQLRRDREAITAALGQNSGPLSVTSLEVVPSVRNSSELTQALSELAAKRAELRTMRAQFTDEYAPVRRLAEEIEVLERQSIPRLASQVVGQIGRREAEMDARLSSASGELRQIPERSIEEARLERSVVIAAELYRTLRQRYETARLTAVSAVPEVTLLDRARVPTMPMNGNERLRMFLMFLMGSLGIAVAVPVVIDRVDSRLRYPEQVTNELGLPILGAVPHIPTKRKQKSLDRNSSVGAVEALREIRLNVSHAFGAAGPLLATVTSPGVGDGKSFIVSNLALAFADLGHRTLIIDGDIRRGQLHRLLGAVRIPGLTDFLSGAASADEIIQPTAYASLDLIACGTRMQAGPELLGSAAMSGLIRELRSQYEVILIDSPPLGAGVDPFLLSTLTGNTLLVLRTGRTDREFAATKLDLLDRLPVRLLGAVLNDVPATGVYRYYGYAAGYEVENEADTRQLEGV